jgi:deoxyhypusine monooxygenase
MSIIDYDREEDYAKQLLDRSNNMAVRCDGLFCLRTIATMSAIDTLIQAFEEEPSSELLKHEICYCLGQMNKSVEHVDKIQKFLEKVIDEDHSKIILHEAVEALGNMNDDNTLKLLKKFENEQSSILYETCYLTIKLIEWNKETKQGETEGLDLTKLKFTTNDPAPPFNYEKEPKYKDVKLLQDILLDSKNYDLF